MTRVFQRAVMGEAALQALIKYHGDVKEPEFSFGDFVGTVQKIGAQVLKVAPVVINTAAPIALALLKTASNTGTTESGFALGPPLAPPSKATQSGETVADFLNGTDSGESFPSESPRPATSSGGLATNVIKDHKPTAPPEEDTSVRPKLGLTMTSPQDLHDKSAPAGVIQDVQMDGLLFIA